MCAIIVMSPDCLVTVEEGTESFLCDFSENFSLPVANTKPRKCNANQRWLGISLQRLGEM